MNSMISLALKGVETKNNIKILFACESGSRAWEFPSKDSDYDVRFIYMRPIEAYLTLTESPDTINCFLPNDLDFTGWDLKKALVLLGKSNICLYEWLGSSIVYKDESELCMQLKRLIPKYLNLKKCYHHYYSIAVNKYNEFVDVDTSSIKKLFYSLRSIIAALWIVKNQTMPHTSFIENIEGLSIDQKVLDKIRVMIELKALSNENHIIIPDPIIIDWMTHTLEYLSSNNHELSSTKGHSIEVLNQIFLDKVTFGYNVTTKNSMGTS